MPYRSNLLVHGEQELYLQLFWEQRTSLRYPWRWLELSLEEISIRGEYCDETMRFFMGMSYNRHPEGDIPATGFTFNQVVAKIPERHSFLNGHTYGAYMVGLSIGTVICPLPADQYAALKIGDLDQKFGGSIVAFHFEMYRPYGTTHHGGAPNLPYPRQFG